MHRVEKESSRGEESKLHTYETAFVRVEGKQIKQRKTIEFKKRTQTPHSHMEGADATGERHLQASTEGPALFSLRSK